MSGSRSASRSSGQVAALTVWRFRSAAGAAEAGAALERLAVGGTLPTSVSGVAAVTWARGTRTPLSVPVPLPATPEALAPAFWGLFFGLVFYLPLIGAAVGAATGTLSGTLADVGIDDSFIHQIRDRVTPGTSALFWLGPEGGLDDVLAELGRKPAEVLFTLLTAEQQQALRTVFGAE